MSAIEVAVSLTYRSFGIGLAADKGKYFWATLVKPSTMSRDDIPNAGEGRQAIGLPISQLR